jgi:dolichyl-phosphooligosaccharide-protein glycotransferase
MKPPEKISMFACLVVLLFSAYSFVTPIYRPLADLGEVGYAAGIVLALASMILIHRNEKIQSAGIASIVALLSVVMVFLLVSTQSYGSDMVISAIALVTFAACFAVSLSSTEVLGFTPKKTASLFFVILVLFVFVQYLYVAPSVEIAKQSGTVLSDNWWNALNWIKNNTQSCSVIATYWDPGHFIRGIAERGVVFDGATQGAVRTIPAPGQPDGLVIVPYDNGIKHIILYKDGNATTSRINDIAISLMTSNETLAVDLLKNYQVQGCDMYYLATSDLLGKSVWWTYFSTWDPTATTATKGTSYSYYILSLQSARPLLSQSALVYTYPVAENQAFVLIGINDTFKAYFQQGNSQPIEVQRLIYYTEAGQALYSESPDAPVRGTMFVQQDKQAVVFMPEQIQDSMFTRMFLFNGAGLKNFQFVNQWGGEVKLFKVNLTA